MREKEKWEELSSSGKIIKKLKKATSKPTQNLWTLKALQFAKKIIPVPKY